MEAIANGLMRKLRELKGGVAAQYAALYPYKVTAGADVEEQPHEESTAAGV